MIDGVRCAHFIFDAIDFRELESYDFFDLNICGEEMSNKTVAQMEAVLLDRIEKAKDKLAKLQKKHQLEIGILAYQHNLHKFSIAQLNQAFTTIAQDFNHENK